MTSQNQGIRVTIEPNKNDTHMMHDKTEVNNIQTDEIQIEERIIVDEIDIEESPVKEVEKENQISLWPKKEEAIKLFKPRNKSVSSSVEVEEIITQIQPAEIKTEIKDEESEENIDGFSYRLFQGIYILNKIEQEIKQELTRGTIKEIISFIRTNQISRIGYDRPQLDLDGVQNKWDLNFEVVKLSRGNVRYELTEVNGDPISGHLYSME